MEIRLNLSLIEYTNKKEIKITLKEDKPLLEILNELGIPEKQIGMVIKNGKWAPKSCSVSDDDVVELFPQLQGG